MKKDALKESKFKKITFNMPTPLYNDIKARAAIDNLNVTSEIITLCRHGLDESKAVELMPFIVEQYLKEQKASKKSKSNT